MDPVTLGAVGISLLALLNSFNEENITYATNNFLTVMNQSSNITLDHIAFRNQSQSFNGTQTINNNLVSTNGIEVSVGICPSTGWVFNVTGIPGSGLCFDLPTGSIQSYYSNILFSQHDIAGTLNTTLGSFRQLRVGNSNEVVIDTNGNITANKISLQQTNITNNVFTCGGNSCGMSGQTLFINGTGSVALRAGGSAAISLSNTNTQLFDNLSIGSPIKINISAAEGNITLGIDQGLCLQGNNFTGKNCSAYWTSWGGRTVFNVEGHDHTGLKNGTLIPHLIKYTTGKLLDTVYNNTGTRPIHVDYTVQHGGKLSNGDSCYVVVKVDAAPIQEVGIITNDYIFAGLSDHLESKPGAFWVKPGSTYEWVSNVAGSGTCTLSLMYTNEGEI